MGAYMLWAIVGGFLAGVFLRSLVPLGFAVVGFLALLAVAILLLSLIDRSKLRVGISLAIILFAVGLGVLRMSAAVLSDDPDLTEQIGAEITIEGVVFDEPDVREASMRIPLKLDSGAGLLVLAQLHTAVRYGDRIRVEGTLRLPEAFAVGTTVPSGVEGRRFNYPAYLAKDGIGYELAFAKNIEVMGSSSTNSLKVGAIWIKQKFLEGLGAALPEPAAGLAGGITVGDKRGLGSELSIVFRTVGLVHIVVLSGYNIMIVMEGLSWLLAWFSVHRYVRFGMSIGVAVLFALMTGLASASVRAAAMAIIAVLGRMSGRVYLASRALAVVAAGMVVWNPFILVFDPGFQLSVLATAGLILFAPIIVTRLKFIPTKLGLREIMATTLATQFTVLPLLLYQNGQLPLFSLPANLLALVAVPWAMLLSTFAALGGILFGSLGVVIAFPAYVLLQYIIEVGNIFAALPYSSLSIGAFSAWWLAPLYGALFGMPLIVLWRRQNSV